MEPPDPDLDIGRFNRGDGAFLIELKPEDLVSGTSGCALGDRIDPVVKTAAFCFGGS